MKTAKVKCRRHLLFDYLFLVEVEPLKETVQKFVECKYPDIDICIDSKKIHINSKKFKWYSIYWYIKNPEQEVLATLKYGLEKIDQEIQDQEWYKLAKLVV